MEHVWKPSSQHALGYAPALCGRLFGGRDSRHGSMPAVHRSIMAFSGPQEDESLPRRKGHAVNTPHERLSRCHEGDLAHAGTADTPRTSRCTGTPPARNSQHLQACATDRQPTHLHDRSRCGLRRPCRVRSHQCDWRYPEQPRPQRLRPQGLRSRRPGPPERIH